MIDTNLPVRFIEQPEDEVIIAGVNPDPECEYPIVGVSRPFSKVSGLLLNWNYSGECITDNPDHKIENIPGYRHIRAYVNVYQDGTTSYGYPSTEAAKEYTQQDSHIPSIGIREINIVVPELEGK